jgi:4-alpha-glucanotransferase
LSEVVDPFARRRSGVLLHPTSLPGKWGQGDLGPEAYRFVEFLAAAKQTVWQSLPLGPTHADRSPYQCLSVHAGNPEMISLELLMADGWLTEGDLSEPPGRGAKEPGVRRERLIGLAYHGFLDRASEPEKAQFTDFMRQHAYWLDDFVLYRSLRRRHNGAPWNQWKIPLRDRHPEALEEVRREDGDYMGQVYFEQYVFFMQWSDLKSYANAREILLFGDVPIFVAYDSADVWARRRYFKLNGEGRPEVIAGVPPDYFSASGQRWGNPHYDWEKIRADGFRWWIERIAAQLELFDIIRIDHFRGFESFWAIPVDEPTAINGRWVKAPGDELFTALKNHFGILPLVAEDLGVITAEVTRLRERFGLPGMKILQFAFDSDARNPYLPHNHEAKAVVYTGTHDNDTTLGWYRKLPPARVQYVDEYLGETGDLMPWPLIRCALESVAQLAMIPMQDILMLGSEHRMNTPGTEQGNWVWRFSWDQVNDELVRRLGHMTALYGR